MAEPNDCSASVQGCSKQKGSHGCPRGEIFQCFGIVRPVYTTWFSIVKETKEDWDLMVRLMKEAAWNAI